MSDLVLGRTNLSFPRTWLSLRVPSISGEIDPLIDACLAAQVPLDISSQPALWGGKLRGNTPVLAACSTFQHERSVDEKHASDLTQAHLIELLSAIGREQIDFYFIRVRRAIEEFQISGLLQATEMARIDGHIRFLGLWSEEFPLAALGLWQFNDAFDVVCSPFDAVTGSMDVSLASMAAKRRVGMITRGKQDPTEAAVALKPADSAQAVREANCV